LSHFSLLISIRIGLIAFACINRWLSFQSQFAEQGHQTAMVNLALKVGNMDHAILRAYQISTFWLWPRTSCYILFSPFPRDPALFFFPLLI